MGNIIFQAEVHAMKKCTNIKRSKNMKGTKIYIMSDSQAALTKVTLSNLYCFNVLIPYKSLVTEAGLNLSVCQE